MSEHPHDDGSGRPEDETAETEKAVGAEVGMSDEGSTFEPEEDPEGHGG